MTTKIEPDAGLALRRAIAWSRRWKWLGAISVVGCLAVAIGIGSWVGRPADSAATEDSTASVGYLAIFGVLIIVVARLRVAVLVGRAFDGAHRADRVRAIGVTSIGKGRLYVAEANGRFAGTRGLLWFGIAPGAPAWLFLTSTSCAFVRLRGRPRYMRQISSPDSMAPIRQSAMVHWRDAETNVELEGLPGSFS
jgi:hypothetical protein